MASEELIALAERVEGPWLAEQITAPAQPDDGIVPTYWFDMQRIALHRAVVLDREAAALRARAAEIAARDTSTGAVDPRNGFTDGPGSTGATSGGQ